MDAAEQKKIVALARKVMTLSRDDLLVHLRFLDRALDQLSLQERFGLEGIASDGNVLFFDPVYVLKMYEREPRTAPRVPGAARTRLLPARELPVPTAPPHPRSEQEQKEG